MRVRRFPVVSRSNITVRHVYRDDASPYKLMGKGYSASFVGINGEGGWLSGTYEDRRDEEGTFTLTFPNTAGSDGQLHRKRFAVKSDPEYRPGDEWVEVWEDNVCVFVGTPITYKIDRTTLEISGSEGSWLLRKQRRTSVAGTQVRSPLDAIMWHCSAWSVDLVDNFTPPPAWTDSATAQTDRGWRYQHMRASAEGDGVEFVGSGVLTTDTFEFAAGWNEPDWRLEYDVVAQTDAASFIALDLSTIGTLTVHDRSTLGVGGDVAEQLLSQTVTNIALEQQGAWVCAYVNGALVGALAVPVASMIVRPRLTGSTGKVRAMLLRTVRPYMRQDPPADRRLPGAPPADGLAAEYFGWSAEQTAGSRSVFRPTREPYAKRWDDQLNFPIANSPTWQAPGNNGQRLAVRWSGAVYLDLAAHDVALRFTYRGQLRVYVAATDPGHPYLDRTDFATPTEREETAAGAGLRATLGNLSGWYPVVVEYWTKDTNRAGLTMQGTDASGAWAVCGTGTAPKLSPLGCYSAQSRYDTHSEQIANVVSAFDYQWTTRPRQLESGNFPGIIEVADRIGRDSDLIVDDDSALDYSAEGSADDLADTLLVDGAGLGDDANLAQLTVEALDYTELGQHTFVHSETESLGDINSTDFLLQRANSLLALRSSPWEQLAAQPAGPSRELTDNIPLTGQLALFRWQPGDGVRVQIDSIDVHDDSPRAIMGVSWPIRPDGRGAPAVTFRLRPRGLVQTLRRFKRAVAVKFRTYQQQVVTATGSVGMNAGSTYEESTVAMPPSMDRVVEVSLVVMGISAPALVFVNGASAGVQVTRPGRYRLVQGVAFGVSPQLSARLDTANGVSATYQLEVVATR